MYLNQPLPPELLHDGARIPVGLPPNARRLVGARWLPYANPDGTSTSATTLTLTDEAGAPIAAPVVIDPGAADEHRLVLLADPTPVTGPLVVAVDIDGPDPAGHAGHLELELELDVTTAVAQR